MVSNQPTQAERNADKLLALMAVRMPPVDPRKAAKRLGVLVLASELEPDVAGKFICEPGRDPRIVLNRRDSLVRQTFTCAHELGHFLHSEASPENITRVQYRNHVSRLGTDHEEIYANEFAASFLMPGFLIRAYHEQGLSDWELAAKFGVSREAMGLRLVSLGLSE
jgi:Zn-dependent peptidase ImmA (M78 family)